MRHPPRLRTDHNTQQYFWEDLIGPDLDEVVPVNGDDFVLDMVHFDLDTKNSEMIPIYHSPQRACYMVD